MTVKKFYLLRSEDVHGNSGTGAVAEGIIFDSGMCAMTWMSDTPTITMFTKITDVKKLHGHEGRTIVVIEGVKKSLKLFESCAEQIKLKRLKVKNKDQS